MSRLLTNLSGSIPLRSSRAVISLALLISLHLTPYYSLAHADESSSGALTTDFSGVIETSKSMYEFLVDVINSLANEDKEPDPHGNDSPGEEEEAEEESDEDDTGEENDGSDEPASSSNPFDRIENPQTLQDLISHLPPKLQRQFTDLLAKNPNMDLLTNQYISDPRLQFKWDQFKQTIMSSSMTDADKMMSLQLAQIGMRKNMAGAANMDFNNIETDFDPGSPWTARFDGRGNDNKLYWQSWYNENTVNTLTYMEKILAINNTQMESSNIMRQALFQFADPASITQGPMGSCWTCTANSGIWAWDSRESADLIYQRLTTDTYTDKQGVTWRDFEVGLRPTESNLAYDFGEGGEQSYVARLGQETLGKMGGRTVISEGGPTPTALRAVGRVTTLFKTPLPTQQSIGGVPGLIRGINNGTVRYAEYNPFPGHSASNSGFVLPDKNGGFAGVGENNNSWGTKGENMFAAKPENAGLFKFPGGGGSRFGGGGGGLLGGLTNLLGKSNQNQTDNQQASEIRQMNDDNAQERYNELNENVQVTVQNICRNLIVESAARNQKIAVPSICRVAIADASNRPISVSSSSTQGTQSAQSSSISTF